jgi:hypothetical protein
VSTGATREPRDRQQVRRGGPFRNQEGKNRPEILCRRMSDLNHAVESSEPDQPGVQPEPQPVTHVSEQVLPISPV